MKKSTASSTKDLTASWWLQADSATAGGLHSKFMFQAATRHQREDGHDNEVVCVAFLLLQWQQHVVEAKTIVQQCCCLAGSE